MTQTLLHIIYTNREIESHERVEDLAQAVHGLAMLARGMGTFEIHTISLSQTAKIMMEQLIHELDRKTAYLRANKDIMCKADITSEMSNVRQLKDTIMNRVKEAKA